MSPLNVKGGKGRLLLAEQNKAPAVLQQQPRDSALSANEFNQSVPVSVADEAAEEEDYFVVEGNESGDEDYDNIKKALAREKEEEEKEDPKIKSSAAILKSVFGEDAEDAVSYEGGFSDGDAVSEDIGVSTSVVEETYSAGEEDENGKVRDSLPFQIAKEFEEEKKEEVVPQDNKKV